LCIEDLQTWGVFVYWFVVVGTDEKEVETDVMMEIRYIM
jgi:hypothetical protein